jgi:hypothetical protein
MLQRDWCATPCAMISIVVRLLYGRSVSEGDWKEVSYGNYDTFLSVS